MRESFSLKPLERKVLEFFQEHPHAVETVRGLATWVTADSSATQEVLDELVERKWLVLHRALAVTGYALTDDDRFLREIHQALGGSSR